MSEFSSRPKPEYQDADRPDGLSWRHSEVIGEIAVPYTDFAERPVYLGADFKRIAVIVENGDGPIARTEADRGQGLSSRLEGDEVCTLGDKQLCVFDAADFDGLVREYAAVVVSVGIDDKPCNPTNMLFTKYDENDYAGHRGSVYDLLADDDESDGPGLTSDELRKKLGLQPRSNPDDGLYT